LTEVKTGRTYRGWLFSYRRGREEGMAYPAQDPQLVALLARAARLREKVCDAQFDTKARLQGSRALIMASRAAIAASWELIETRQVEIAAIRRGLQNHLPR
jgi:hypothetical protein